MLTTGLSHLIQSRCVNTEHAAQDARDRVFVHADGWAYCAAGRAAPDHRFVPTGGLERKRVEGGVGVRTGR